MAIQETSPKRYSRRIVLKAAVGVAAAFAAELAAGCTEPKVVAIYPGPIEVQTEDPVNHQPLNFRKGTSINAGRFPTNEKEADEAESQGRASYRLIVPKKFRVVYPEVVMGQNTDTQQDDNSGYWFLIRGAIREQIPDILGDPPTFNRLDAYIYAGSSTSGLVKFDKNLLQALLKPDVDGGRDADGAYKINGKKIRNVGQIYSSPTP